MIPILLISNNKKTLDEYLNINFKKNANLFFEVIPSTKEYSIEDIKGLIKETKVFHPKIRIYFLANFHLSSIPAQNSFLKLLEEPPANVQFVLSTNNKNSLLPTIVSRVKIIKLQGNDTKNVIGVQFIAPIISGLNLVKFTITDRESAKDILLQIIIFFREKLESDKNSPLIIKEAIRLKALLENNNLNPQLTVDQVLIFIWKQYKIKLSS